MPSERIQRRIDSLLDDADEAVKQQQWDVVRDRAKSDLRLEVDSIYSLLPVFARLFGPARNNVVTMARRIGTDGARSQLAGRGMSPANGDSATAEAGCRGKR